MPEISGNKTYACARIAVSKFSRNVHSIPLDISTVSAYCYYNGFV
jgi:hypothetical protein